MLGRSLGSRSKRKKILLRDALGPDLTHRRPPLGEGAGLVEQDLSDQPEALECLSGPHQDAVVGGLAGAAHDRQRCRNAHGARIAHDQDAQAGENGALHVGDAREGPGPRHPADYGNRRNHQNGRRVDAQHAIN